MKEKAKRKDQRPRVGAYVYCHMIHEPCVVVGRPRKSTDTLNLMTRNGDSVDSVWPEDCEVIEPPTRAVTSIADVLYVLARTVNSLRDGHNGIWPTEVESIIRTAADDVRNATFGANT